MKNLIPMISALCLVAPIAAEPEAKALRVLQLTGGCCHDYEGQKEVLAAGLGERTKVEVTTLHEGGKGNKHQYAKLKEKGWEKDFDVVLYNICFAREEDVDYIESITDTHKAGLPAVALHCTMHSHHWSAKTEAWEEFIGVTSPNHGPKAAITMKPKVKDHPVMKGFPAEWKTPQGELYNIKKVHDTATVLIEGDNGKVTQPCVWVNDFGGTRVFGTTVGHHTETMAEPVYLDLVTRGLLWVTGNLNDDGTPAEGFGAK